MKNKVSTEETSIRSSAAEYLTFVASTGDNESSIEMLYEDENIWLTQKMMAELYNVEIPTINEHISKIFADMELAEGATIRNFRIVQDRLFQSDFDRFIFLEEAVDSLEMRATDKESHDG